MSDLIAITFEHPQAAAEVRERLKDLGADGPDLDDAAVVSRSLDGETHVDDEIDRGVKIGALGGGLIGMILTFAFPLLGVVTGAAGGALVGRFADLGLDKRFISNVTESLRPGTSALFLLVRSGNADATVATLKPFRGQVYETTLNPDAESELRRALKDRTW